MCPQNSCARVVVIHDSHDNKFSDLQQSVKGHMQFERFTRKHKKFDGAEPVRVENSLLHCDEEARCEGSDSPERLWEARFTPRQKNGSFSFQYTVAGAHSRLTNDL